MKMELEKKYDNAIVEYYQEICKRNDAIDCKNIFHLKITYFLECFEHKINVLKINGEYVKWLPICCLDEWDINGVLKEIVKAVPQDELKELVKNILEFELKEDNSKEKSEINWDELNEKYFYFEDYNIFKNKLNDFYIKFEIKA
ncbi:hypothetical protein [Flavobacterium branchiophilum]|uniref:Uncharacterized protein n=1 Tax=Flavobacterium branchiophilum TaxID=55197 RepID=A0A2H3KP61_9FLAO|nr:hypothetical protein [Flavobacterium branchiophilum]PDS25625.1 hypothetical protein B0A77_04290 [Flavobacterium branchiophilum]